MNKVFSEATLKNEFNDNTPMETAVLGMPHRGRLATLVVLNDYPFSQLLRKISGKCDLPAELKDRVDDIPTHIAVSNTKKVDGREFTFTMVHNPSHLESQNAIVLGKSKAK